jgi:diguanylate cyclase (GGDEF)-like protein
MLLWDSRNRDREQARQAASNVIATLSSEIDRNLELYDLSLQAVVDGMKLPGLAQLTPEMRHLVLFDRAATAKDMGSIFILDKDGAVILDSRTLNPPTDIHAQRDYFIVPAQNPAAGAYLSHPWLAPNGEYLIAISRRLFSSEDSFSGVVVGTLRLSYFQKMFGRLELRNGDSLTLVREDGVIITRAPFSAAMIVRNLASTPIFKRISTYPSGSFESTAGIDGVDRLYVHQRVGEYPLYLTFGSSIDAIYASWRQRALGTGLLMLIFCGINLALVLFLTRALKLRSEAEHQLSIMATTDSLTGLCNRRRLDQVFELEWRRAQRVQDPVALLMIDADKFKAYNDQFGHQSGDAALVAIARCIESTTRRAVEIAARYGGEEFAVLLPGTSLADAIDLAERIRHSVLALRADQQGRPDSTPTISIGAASLMPRQGLLPRDLIKAADTALYEAKSNGRNRTEPAPRQIEALRNSVAA